MKAVIYPPKKNPMQSKSSKEFFWKLEFIEQPGDRFIENLEGKISSCNMNQELNKLVFETKEAAIKYAENHNIEYEIKLPNEHKIQPKSYADNFKAIIPFRND